MKELVEIIKGSNADFVILGGDFNCDPVENQDETTLKDITDIMVSSIEEIFPKKEVKIFINTKKFYNYSLGLVDSEEGHLQ